MNEMGVFLQAKGGILAKKKHVPLTPSKLTIIFADGRNVLVEPVKVGQFKGFVSVAGARVGPPYAEPVEEVMTNISKKVRKLTKGRLPDIKSTKRYNRSSGKQSVLNSLRDKETGALLVYQDAVLTGPDGTTFENDNWSAVPGVV